MEGVQNITLYTPHIQYRNLDILTTYYKMYQKDATHICNLSMHGRQVQIIMLVDKMLL
jgi:sulfur relay (sulfurtransferase) DsrF/TusC family protein